MKDVTLQRAKSNDLTSVIGTKCREVKGSVVEVSEDGTESSLKG